MVRPIFSVVIPCFNAAATVEQTVASVRAQTLGDFEIVAVDNNSTDRTPEILSTLACTEPRLRIVQEAVQGLSAARNGGIRASRGRYIALLDADDLFDPDYLEAHACNLAEPLVGISYARIRLVDSNGRPTGQVTQPRLSGIGAADLLRTNPCTSMIVVRREVFDSVGLFDERLRRVEDQEWLFRAAAAGFELKGIGRALASYRITPGGLSNDLAAMLAAHGQMLDAAAAVAPALVARHRRVSHAAMLRYCARRAMDHGVNRAAALSYLAAMLKAAPDLALREPMATGKVMLAVLAPRLAEFVRGRSVVSEAGGGRMIPRVSVVIPLYQTQGFIGTALRSVLAQTFRDFEVIVVDDGSRDEGPAIARATGDDRVRVVTQENRGLAGARNTGIRHARANFVALLDADDVWEPTKLERHVAHLDADPSLDVSFSASRLIDESGCDLGLVQSPLGGLEDADFFCRNPIGNGSSPVLRRRAFDRIEFNDPLLGRSCWFDERFRQSEDVECWMRLKAAAGCRFGYLAEPLTLYRVNSGGLSADVASQLATWRRFRDKVSTYAPELVAREGARAEAYQLRYLARRAVRSDDRKQALALILASLRLFPRTLAEEPARTLATMGAAFAKRVLPSDLYKSMERTALHWASRSPALRV